MIQLLPINQRIDPIADTWRRGLVATALEHGLRPLCWHIGHDKQGATVTGYVTVSLLHDASTIRSTWAQHLGLVSDQAGGYTGRSDGLAIALPDAVDPDEHCQVCGHVFDPRDTSPTGRGRHASGDICRACAARTPLPTSR